MFKLKNIKSTYPSLLAYNDRNAALAELALDNLWMERCEERGIAYLGDRSGSCKFAALLARELFGGRLAGNFDHVFVVLNHLIIDLNSTQSDAVGLGNSAYTRMDFVLCQPDYRDALSSCLPRVHKWADWVINQSKKN